MSDLESRVSPILSPLILSAPTTILDIDRQTSIAIWTTKMAMIFEFALPFKMTPHYTAYERRQLKDTLLPPQKTAVWIARCTGKTNKDEKIAVQHLTQRLEPSLGRGATFGIGQFVVQILSYRLNEVKGWQIHSHPAKRGTWDDSLIRIWPPTFGVTWPPSTVLLPKDVLRLNARFAAYPSPHNSPHRIDNSL